MSTQRNVPWTLEAIRLALLDGRSPRDVGGEDAHIDKPLPQSRYLPVFLRELQTRAEAMCHTIGDWSNEMFDRLASAIRTSPFALETAAQKVDGAVQDVGTRIKGRLDHEAASVDKLRAEVRATEITYNRDLQGADTTHPRGGWRDGTVLLLRVGAVLLLEIAASGTLLRDAIGSTRALMTGLVFSLVAVGGGALSAGVLLRSLKHTEATSWMRLLQWALAGLIGSLVLLLMYVGAGYRAALIDGTGDTLAKIRQPAAVLFNFDVLTLLLLSATGYCVAAYEIWTHYHGHRPQLRASGLAKVGAHERLGRVAEDLKTYAASEASQGDDTLREIDTANAEWVRSTAAHADEATATAIECNRRVDLVRRAVASITAEYLDGYHEVRASDRFAAMPEIAIGLMIGVPAIFTGARAAAVTDARNVSQCVQTGHLAIAQLRADAVRRIDELCGFRGSGATTALLPMREAAE